MKSLQKWSDNLNPIMIKRWRWRTRLCLLATVSIQLVAVVLFIWNFNLEIKITPKTHDTPLEQLAKKSESDKFWFHKYQNAYAKYMEPRRFAHVKMLEIGLGCDKTVNQPGKSVEFWLEYFYSVDLWVYEYDGKCLEDFLTRKGLTNVHRFAGDQTNRSDLHRFINLSGSQFDVIVEDGNHEIEGQKTSFEVLFPTLKPGGVYFMEDLYYNFLHESLGGHFQGHFGAFDVDDNNTLKMLYNLIDNLMNPKFMSHKYVGQYANPKHLPPDSVMDHELIESIDCFHQICVIVRSGKQGIRRVSN